MDELAVVQPHGPDRVLLANTRRRTGALIAVIGRTESQDASAFTVLVHDGGLLLLVGTSETGPPMVRTRRLRPLTLRSGPSDSFPQSWNEAVLRWQRRALLPSSPSAAPA